MQYNLLYTNNYQQQFLQPSIITYPTQQIYSPNITIRITQLQTKIISSPNRVKNPGNLKTEKQNEIENFHRQIQAWIDAKSKKVDENRKLAGEKIKKASLAIDLTEMGVSTLPKGIEKNKNLTAIFLGSNQLTTLPEEFGLLPEIRSLQLSDNNLSSIPSTLGRLKKLKSLTIRGNPLLQTLPRALACCRSLTSIDIADKCWNSPLRAQAMKILEVIKNGTSITWIIEDTLRLNEKQLDLQCVDITDVNKNLPNILDEKVFNNATFQNTLESIKLHQTVLDQFPKSLLKLSALTKISFT